MNEASSNIGKKVVREEEIAEQSLISVIMPVHNCEEHVLNSVNSVLRQTHHNLELICVVDNSSDESEDIIRQIAKNDSRVKVVNNPLANTGTGGARNFGLSIASGQFVSFIDDDDFMETDFLSVTFEELCGAKVDIVQCAIRYIFKNKALNRTYGNGILLGEQCQLRIDSGDGQASVFPMVVAKLYKVALFKDIAQKRILFEDIEFTPRLLTRVNSISVIDQVLYNYNKRYSSVTNWSEIPKKDLRGYFDGIYQSICPYFDPELVKKRKYWGTTIPSTTYANVNNLVRGVGPLLCDAPVEFRECFLKEYDAFVGRLEDLIPPDDKVFFFSKLISPLSYLEVQGFVSKKASLFRKMLKKANFKRRFVKVCEYFVPIFDSFVAKNDKIWVFSSWAYYPRHTLDNPRAVFESVKDDKRIKKVVIMHGEFNHDTLVKEGENVIFLSVFSLKAFYYQIRAGVFFTGNSLHRTFGYRKLKRHKDRKFVQLWHAITYKKIGLDVGRAIEPYWPKEVKKYTLFTSSSDFDRQTMIKSFSPSAPDRVVATGAPRHDLLLMPEDKLPADYQEQLAWVRERKGDKKLFLYAPTWRSKNDAKSEFTIDELSQLDQLCKKHNVLLGHRMHLIMRKNATRSYFSDNFLNLDGVPETTILLRQVDGLITDYSSLFFDVMQKEVPVILYHKDYASYSKTRGLPYTLKESRPHLESVDSFEKLYDQLDIMFAGKYELDEQYFDVRDRFLKFRDANNAQRVLKALNIGKT